MNEESRGRSGSNYKWVGKVTRRPDGVDKVTGRARYGDDMKLPGLLHAKVLRSPHAHAKILSIDTSKAAALKGVKGVVTSADIPDHPEMAPPYPPIINDLHDISRNVMAREKVLYDGHAVAAVAATTEAIAKQALKLIEVEYEVLAHVLDPIEAAKPDAPVLHEHLFTYGVDPKPEKPSNLFRTVNGGRGDVEKGFAEADVIVEREFSSEPVHQGYIEPLACVASASEDGSVELWTSTQGAFVARALCAKLLKMDIAMLRVTPSEIGGGFGGKTTIYGEPVAIRLSQMTGRPVRMVMSRSELFRASGPTLGSRSHIKIGVKRDGTVTAADVVLWHQSGAFKGSPTGRAMDTFFSSYTIENAKVTVHDVCVNRPKVAAYRAPGAPMAAYPVEMALNELAEKIGMDPIDLRAKNAVQDGGESLMGTKYGRIGLNEVLEAAKNHPHYAAPLGPNQGRGFALGYWMHGGGLSSASVNLQDDGTLSVATGNPDIGGSRSSMRAMAAEEMGIDIEAVKPIVADTGSLGYSHLTAGSRTTFATGMAVINCVREIMEKLCALAAKKWDIPGEDVRWDSGQAIAADSHDLPPLTLKELAGMATKMGGAIAGHSEINAGGAGAAFSAQLVDVEVDPETGFVKPLRYTVVQDVGRAISPDYVEGQMQGGAVQGIGWALNEEYVYGEDGRLQNNGFLDYRMPVASDVPMIDTVMIEVPNPNHPYGVRGVGEPCLVPAPAAVANAVENAIGKKMGSLPFSPPKVLKAMQRG
ncbi:MAG: xanthine dehydrogenase family protein molybdopterin-binding subunit [Rhodospirillaceae bacterium]|nr:xanthine dehydrogenase family protein molybdopterin-binding subunit [Rhodospirillaceae bacterium]